MDGRNKPTENENLLSVYKNINQIAFRGDDREPQVVFEAGFQHKGATWGYYNHAKEIIPLPQFRQAQQDVVPASAVCCTLNFDAAPLFPLPIPYTFIVVKNDVTIDEFQPRTFYINEKNGNLTYSIKTPEGAIVKNIPITNFTVTTPLENLTPLQEKNIMEVALNNEHVLGHIKPSTWIYIVQVQNGYATHDLQKKINSPLVFCQEIASRDIPPGDVICAVRCERFFNIDSQCNLNWKEAVYYQLTSDIIWNPKLANESAIKSKQERNIKIEKMLGEKKSKCWEYNLPFTITTDTQPPIREITKLEHDQKKQIHLLNAVANGNIDTAKFFLETNVDPNFKNTEGMSPLLFAVVKQNLAMIELLLAKKANPNLAGTAHMVPPLFFAVHLSNTPIINLLVKYNADPNFHVGEFTPLFLAAQNGNKEAVNALLQSPNLDLSLPCKVTIAALLAIVEKSGCNKERFNAYLEKAKLTDPDITTVSITPFEIANILGHDSIASLIKPTISKKKTDVPSNYQDLNIFTQPGPHSNQPPDAPRPTKAIPKQNS